MTFVLRVSSGQMMTALLDGHLQMTFVATERGGKQMYVCEKSYSCCEHEFWDSEKDVTEDAKAYHLVMKK